MESARFDRFARVLGATTSRRAGLGLAVAVLTGAAVADPASAAATCRRGRQTCQRNAQCCSGTCRTGRDVPVRDRNRCTCEAGTTLCGSTCVDTRTNKRHCGACGNACVAGDTCVDGDCLIHQQCYSRDGGICYLTPNGQEVRADGFFLVSIGGGFPPIPCAHADDCVGVHEVCDRAGVSCPCLRAIDFFDGYQALPDFGEGVCFPMLDNGDGAVLCQPDEGTTVCTYSAAEQEMLMCRDSVTFEGPCNGASCAGVGGCDDPDVDCACVIAWMVIIGSNGIYLDVNPFESSAMQPTCVGYVSPVGGVCPPPV